MNFWLDLDFIETRYGKLATAVAQKYVGDTYPKSQETAKAAEITSFATGFLSSPFDPRFRQYPPNILLRTDLTVSGRLEIEGIEVKTWVGPLEVSIFRP